MKLGEGTEKGRIKEEGNEMREGGDDNTEKRVTRAGRGRGG